MVLKPKRFSTLSTASKAISFAAACVSMLTLTSNMLTTFNDGTMDPFARKMMLGSVGVAVILVVIGMAVGMIARGTRKLKQLNQEVTNG